MTVADRGAKLSLILHDILGSDNVYLDPPESIRMSYPAIVYNLAKIDATKADNIKYQVFNRYEVVFIRKDAEDPILERLLNCIYATHDRSFKSDDLYHDTFTFYID